MSQAGPGGAAAPTAGRQPERTALSWSRTCLGLGANGFLLLLRNRDPGVLGLALASWAGLLAVGVVAVAASRTRQLRTVPRGGRVRAGWEVTALGVGVTVLALGSAAVFVVSGSL